MKANQHGCMAFTLLIAGLAGCDAYHGYGCIAPESHPAVAHVRSLSAQQLKTAYVELHKLGNTYSDKRTVVLQGARIPDNLRLLKAEVIRVDRSRPPYVILANCFDQRIELSLSAADHQPASITLHWAEPTGQNSYARGSQILWQDQDRSIEPNKSSQ